MTTPGEGRPQGEPLPNFLPEAEQDPVFSFTHARQLEETARSLTPEQEGAFRATIVAECPTTNDTWEASGVKAGYGEDAYHTVLVGTVANGARDTTVAASMLDQLRPLNDQLSERIPSSLAQIIVTRTLNTPEAQPEAVVEVIKWASGFISDAAQTAEAMGKALHHKGPEQLAALLPLFEQLGQGELSDKAREIIQGYEDRARQEAEKQQAAAEKRAAEAAKRRALEERRNYIRDNAIPAFREIAGSYGVTTSEEVALSELQDADELLLAASCVVTQAEHLSLDLSEENAPIGVLATAVLDRAVELRRAGVSFPDHDYTLNTQEERPVLAAPSVDEFWNRLAKLAEWRSEINPGQVSSLYEQWRSRFISTRQQEGARTVLHEHGIDPNSDFKPEGIDFLTVRVRHGTVAYDSIDEIIHNMREYFVPRMDRFEAGIVAKEAVENAVGSAATASMLSSINPGGDGAIMDRLEQEMRAWVAQEDGQPYRDSWDDGGGDPYKYSGGLFSRHGIGITRSEDGRFRFSLGGRGYNFNSSRPTQQIDDFAAFVGRAVEYEGDVELEYRGEPPSEFVKGTLTRTIREETKVEDAVAVSLPVEAVFRQLQGLLNLRDEAIAGLWQIVESDPRGTDIPGIRDGNVIVGISPYSRFPRQPQRSADGTRLEGYTTIHKEEREKHRYFFLPEMGVHIKSNEPDQQASLAQLFHAIGTMVRTSPRKSYSHGYVGGYNSFKPHDEL